MKTKEQIDEALRKIGWLVAMSDETTDIAQAVAVHAGLAWVLGTETSSRPVSKMLEEIGDMKEWKEFVRRGGS